MESSLLRKERVLGVTDSWRAEGFLYIFREGIRGPVLITKMTVGPLGELAMT